MPTVKQTRKPNTTAKKAKDAPKPNPITILTESEDELDAFGLPVELPEEAIVKGKVYSASEYVDLQLIIETSLIAYQDSEECEELGEMGKPASM
jgi:hypothetical protein